MTDHGTMFCLIFGRRLMQATHPPRKMRGGMRLMFVHCVAKSAPPHFVVSAMSIIVLILFTCTLVGTALSAREASLGEGKTG